MNGLNSKISCVALIPARSGSKRIRLKNIKRLGHHPLVAYTIIAAIKSGVFKRVVVSTDNKEIASISKKYGAEIPFLRPSKYATDVSPDIEWVKYTIDKLKRAGESAECFSILRPTSPFRQPETIRRAWTQFLAAKKADSLRAVERCKQHPAKMWRINGKYMKPILQNPDKETVPWHSRPYQTLPKIYVQNASIEIVWGHIPLKTNTISGKKIVPFLTKNYEGFDINNQDDWVVAEYLIKNNLAQLPKTK